MVFFERATEWNHSLQKSDRVEKYIIYTGSFAYNYINIMFWGEYYENILWGEYYERATLWKIIL